MEPERSETGGAFSFRFTKKKESTKLKEAAFKDDDRTSNEVTDFISSSEGLQANL